MAISSVGSKSFFFFPKRLTGGYCFFLSCLGGLFAGLCITKANKNKRERMKRRIFSYKG